MLKDVLKNLREAKRLTKKVVAAGIGVTERAYIAYEYGERDVSTETLSKLADFYHVSTDYLLERNTDEVETIDKLSEEFSMSALEKIILDEYLSLPAELRENAMDFLYKAVKRVQSETVKPRSEISEKTLTPTIGDDMAATLRVADSLPGHINIK